MGKVIRMPAPKDVEDYLATVFPDPAVRRKSENVQKYRDILTRMWFASRSLPGAMDQEELREYIREKIYSLDGDECINGVWTMLTIAQELKAEKHVKVTIEVP